MKNKVFAVVLVIALLLSAFGIDAARAGAYATEFTSAVTYMNVGTAATTTLKLYFYATPDSTTPTSYDLPSAPVNAAGAIFIGSVGDLVVADGFQGSAYLESDQMMLVTLVQIPQGTTTVKNRALSNGFVTGGPTALIPTVLKNAFDYNTIFSVQNADAVANVATIKFYDATTQALVHTITRQIAAGAAYYVDAYTIPELGTTFSGSVVATALKLDGVTPGKIVASSMELAIAGTGVYSFEGVEAGAMKLYMSTALCAAYGSSTSFAVQNTHATLATNITITYTDTAGLTYTETKTGIAPGAKAAFITCDAMPSGGIGAAVITSSVAPVVAVGKVYGAGRTTAFNGVAVGAQEIGLPYVRWGTTADFQAGLQQRTYLSVQNIGRALVQDEQIDVEYWDYLGNLVTTFTYTVPAGGMANGAKFATNPGAAGLTEFGIYLSGTKYGGSAIVRGPDGSQLAAIGRVESVTVYPLTVAEDYNSQPIP